MCDPVWFSDCLSTAKGSVFNEECEKHFSVGLRTLLRVSFTKLIHSLAIWKTRKYSLFLPKGDFILLLLLSKHSRKTLEDSSRVHVDDVILCSAHAESNKCTLEPHPNGKMLQFYFLMESKSFQGQEEVG